MSLTPWKILSSRYIFPKFRSDKCELPSGKPYRAYVMEFDAWANVLPITKNNEVVLVRQYRHGVQQTLYELPGGVVNEGESPLEGAKRELMEETGYSYGKIIEVGRLYPNPAIQQNTLYCYLATDVERTGDQHLDESEEIEVHLVPFEKLLVMERNGEFLHALHVAVLFKALSYLNQGK